MKLRKNFILIIYFYSFITFFLVMFFYIPRPRFNTIAPILNNKNNFILSKTNFDSHLSRKIKRQINIGNSYFLLLQNKDSLKLTAISFRAKENFNLAYYARYIPELIIDADEIVTVKNNNYGIDKSITKNKYQSCLFSIKDPFYVYEFDKDNTVYRANDYDYWLSIIKKEIRGLLKNVKKQNINCLLITTYNPEIFENEKELINLISKNFFYE